MGCYLPSWLFVVVTQEWFQRHSPVFCQTGYRTRKKEKGVGWKKTEPHALTMTQSQSFLASGSNGCNLGPPLSTLGYTCCPLYLFWMFILHKIYSWGVIFSTLWVLHWHNTQSVHTYLISLIFKVSCIYNIASLNVKCGLVISFPRLIYLYLFLQLLISLNIFLKFSSTSLFYSSSI